MIVVLPPPTLVNVSDSVCVVDTGTLPKLSVVGFDVKVPGEVPLPDRGMVKVGFEALDVMVTLPLFAPFDGGVNETLNVALCPPSE